MGCYSINDASKLTGLTYPVLQYLRLQGVICPQKRKTDPGTVKGGKLFYTDEDLIKLRQIAAIYPYLTVRGLQQLMAVGRLASAVELFRGLSNAPE